MQIIQSRKISRNTRLQNRRYARNWVRQNQRTLASKILPVTKLGRDYFTSPKALQDFMKKNTGKELSIR